MCLHHVCSYVPRSIRMEQLVCHWADFYENLYLSICRKFSKRLKFFWDMTRITGTLHEYSVNLWFYVAEFFLDRDKFQTKRVGEVKTHILCSIMLFWRSFRLRDDVENYGREREKVEGGHSWQYGTCVLHAGYKWLQSHTQNMSYLLLFHDNNSCTNAPHYLLTRTWPDLEYNCRASLNCVT
jgi:hypothetical protein